MWAVAQRHHGAALNVMILPWRVRGPLRLDALGAAMADLSARHPTLRARLLLENGQLVQQVDPAVCPSITLSEPVGASAEARVQAAVEHLREEGRRPLDLGAGPVFKVHLVRLSPDDHVLCLFVHHAMCDGWSSQVLVRDLAALYVARCQGFEAALPALAEQYADFAKAQFHTHESGGYDAEIEYWRNELANSPVPLTLPAVGPRKGSRDWRCLSPTHDEPAHVLEAIRAFARMRKVTAFSVLLASLAVLLHQRTGADDLLIGVSTINRWNKNSLQFVGCATNLLPARIRLHGTMSFRELCTQVHGTLRRLLAYGRVPFELVLRETKTSLMSGLAMPVWCQSREAAPPTVVESTGLTLTPFVIERAALLTEIEVDMLESAEGLTCEFAHRPALFAGSMIQALMAAFGAIIRAVPDEPDARVRDLCRHAQPSRPGTEV
jgi:hypothetical protein